MNARRPTALKLLDGVQERRINTDEPLPLTEKPKCPPWFTVAQQQLWRSTCRQIAGMKMLSAADYVSLVNYVVMSELGQRLSQALGQGELVIAGEHLDHANPLLLALDRVVMRCTMLAREFGLTPSSRASLRMSAVGTNTEAERNTAASYFRSA